MGIPFRDQFKTIQSECPIGAFVSRINVLTGPPSTCLGPGDSHCPKCGYLLTDGYDERNGETPSVTDVASEKSRTVRIHLSNKAIGVMFRIISCTLGGKLLEVMNVDENGHITRIPTSFGIDASSVLEM